MNRKVLLCATNAGGVKNLLPIADELSRRELPHRFLVGASVRHLAEALPASSRLVLPSRTTAGFLGKLLRSFRPSLVIVGTTSYMSPDRALTRLARASGIKTIAVLDEWFNYRLRFEGVGGVLQFLPDLIAAMDRRAVAEAREEGVPPAILRVTGNPALAAVGMRRERYRSRAPRAPDFLPVGVKVVTFVSEEFKADYSDAHGLRVLGPYQGYDEETVLNDILAAAKAAKGPVLVVEKLHPGSRRSPRPARRLAEDIMHVTIKNTDVSSLLWHSDAVIGMRSIALLEAAILGKPVASYQPGLRSANQCSAVKRGAAPLLRDPQALAAWLRRALSNGAARRQPARWSFLSPRSSQNILRLGGILH